MARLINRTIDIRVIALAVSMVIMFTLARWGFVKPESTVENYINANAFWNFTFFEMLIGNILVLIIVSLVFKKAVVLYGRKSSSKE